MSDTHISTEGGFLHEKSHRSRPVALFLSIFAYKLTVWIFIFFQGLLFFIEWTPTEEGARNHIYTIYAVHQIRCGGELATNAYALVGSYAESFVNSFNADICFFSVSNLTANGQLTDNSIAENIIRRAMISKSKRVVLMLDSHKIGEPCISNLCSLDQIDIIACEKDISHLFPEHGHKFI